MKQALITCLFAGYFTFTLTAQTTFASKQIIDGTPGASPFAMSTADCNNDTFVDIVIGTNTGNTIEYYQNNGNKTFASSVLVTNTLQAIGGIILVDLDGINGPDILATGYTNDKLTWYPNNGSGVFGPEQTISSTVLGASGLSVGTIDAGATIDVAVTAYDGNTVVWYSNDGAGNFTGPNTIDNTIPSPGSVNLKDVDGDGDLDALISNAQFIGNVDVIEIFENDLVPGGSVAFTKASSSVASGKNYIFNASFEDLDGDNNLDIMATEVNITPGTGTFYIYEDGDTDPFNGSAFTETMVTTSIKNPSVAKHADLDDDGDKDIILSSAEAFDGGDGDTEVQLVFFLNDGSGNYGAEVVPPIDETQSQTYVYSIADLDNDLDMDIATCDFNFSDITWFENLKYTLSDEEFELGVMSIFPNPATDMIRIKNGILPFDFKVYNMIGQTIMEKEDHASEYIDVSQLNNGMYFLELESTIIKFIKE